MSNFPNDADPSNPGLPYGITEQEVTAEADRICAGPNGFPCPACWRRAIENLTERHQALTEAGLPPDTVRRLANMPARSLAEGYQVRAPHAEQVAVAPPQGAAPYVRDPSLPRRILQRDEIIRGADMAQEALTLLTTRAVQAKRAAENVLGDLADMCNLTPEARSFLEAHIVAYMDAHTYLECSKLLLGLAPTEADHDARVLAEAQARLDARLAHGDRGEFGLGGQEA